MGKRPHQSHAGIQGLASGRSARGLPRSSPSPTMSKARAREGRLAEAGEGVDQRREPLDGTKLADEDKGVGPRLQPQSPAAGVAIPGDEALPVDAVGHDHDAVRGESEGSQVLAHGLADDDRPVGLPECAQGPCAGAGRDRVKKWRIGASGLDEEAGSSPGGRAERPRSRRERRSVRQESRAWPPAEALEQGRIPQYIRCP